MRLGGRIAAAIEVLEDMERRHRPSADALKDWGLSHRFAGAGDRAAIGNIVYDALRRRRSAGWLVDSDTPRGQVFGALLLESGETAEGINATLEGDRFAPAPLSAQELSAIAGRNLSDAPQAVRADCPDWCGPLIEATFGDAWIDEARALSARPPLDLRVNTLLSTRERVLSELSEAAPTATALAPHGVRIAPIAGNGRHPNVQAEPAFQKGWFEVQDEGSQIAAELSGARPGMQVLDLCAGAGGKTLALAAAMENSGQVHAFDAEKVRLAPIFDRLRRAEARNVQVVARPSDLEPLKGKMDVVLVDAPCTGSGTWRRRPDAKWRLTPKQVDVRRAEQARVLADAATYVRPGGRLAYVTCSVFREENQEQIGRFLSGAPGFEPLDHREIFERAFPGKAARAHLADGPGIVLSPLRTGTDGFYFAALRRTA
ncbi:MAG: RsmB/NOP family class I SAM-dependent RNA methyltransferase [Rhizobiaceae bacterium]|nr:RsmB/NOP family class I SAM-dependent RNA methyltransferase [Rhizobiaceae bacterium]